MITGEHHTPQSFQKKPLTSALTSRFHSTRNDGQEVNLEILQGKARGQP